MIEHVVIPVLNRYDLLNRCLDSIPAGVQILVIDNGDAYEGASRSGVRVVRVPSNLGVPASWNLGIKLFPFAPGWLLLNSDAWFAEGAWDRFDAACSSDGIVLAGSPPWCCAWIGRRVADRVGLFCEAFYPAYMEDIDYEERARRLGITVEYSDAPVGHDNSSTINSDTRLAQLNAATHARNISIYNARWHGLADHEVPGPMEWSTISRVASSWDANQ